MAEKDIAEKILLSYADVFLDCENVLMYGGRQKLKANEMQPAPTESFYFTWGRGDRKEGMHNQFCDKSFYHMQEGKIRTQYIVENETQLERRQVLRQVSYQGGAYRQQLESKQAVYPVIITVIDWTRKSAYIPLSLHELMRQDGAEREELDLTDDVKMNVIHMNRLTAEVRQKFTSDMGFVADFLNEGSFEGRKGQKIIHVAALCSMMEALTGDYRFTSNIDKMLRIQERGGDVIMCEYIDMLEAIGEERGKEIGKEIGEDMLTSLLMQLYASGREEEVKLVLEDKCIRKQMYQEFCIAEEK